MRLRALVALTVPLFLAACAYPVTSAEQGAAASGLYFTGAPESALVLVDMADAGLAAVYDGKKAILVVKPGRHHVIVRSGTTTIYDQVVYVGAASRVKIKADQQ